MTRRIHAPLLLGAAVWCAAILAAPLLHMHSVYSLFSIICHQDASRSWHLLGEPLAVCIRCSSIYFGFLAGLLFVLTPNAAALKVAIGATLAEFLLAQLLADITILRVLSGIMLGAMAAPFIQTGVEQMLERNARAAV